ncbi:hypothetical protein ACE6H2_019793 [Prunus campanulata]
MEMVCAGVVVIFKYVKTTLDAQCKYNQSLYAVAVAIRSFVKSHSSPFDSDSEPTKNTNTYPSSDSGISRSSSSEIDREKKLQESSNDREEVEENSDHNAGTDGEELGLVLLNDEAVREERTGRRDGE